LGTQGWARLHLGLGGTTVYDVVQSLDFLSRIRSPRESEKALGIDLQFQKSK